MKTDLTDITVVLDRSGSMQSCQMEAQNGLNHFIKEQKALPGNAIFSLVQFDTVYEFVYRGVPISTVGDFTLVPRGMTALLDAVGRAINETGERLKNLAEDDRPGLVVFVIVTDGLENSSHEFKKSQIKEMITRQQEIYHWQLTFLGANQDAFAEANALGIAASATVNYVSGKLAEAFASASNNIARMRGMSSTGGVVSNSYTENERKGMTND